MQTIEKIIKELEIESKDKQNIFSGFDKIDRYTKGFKPGQLTILGGRHNMGKSMFAINIVRNLISNKENKIAVFTLEYSAKQWAKLFTKSINHFTNKEQKLKNIPPISNQLFIDDTKNISIIDLMEKVTILKRSENIDFLIVDYLQLISGINNNLPTHNENKFEKTTRLLKVLALGLNIPILLISSISYRKIKKSRVKNMPRLSYLKEYGLIENYAEVIFLLHRWDYYEYKKNDRDSDLTNKLELIIAKNENGALTGINLEHDPETKTFKEI